MTAPARAVSFKGMRALLFFAFLPGSLGLWRPWSGWAEDRKPNIVLMVREARSE